MYYSERRVPTFVEAIHKAQREREREDSEEDSEICESVTVKSAVVFMFREKGGTFSVKACLATGETIVLRCLGFNSVWDLGVSQNKSSFFKGSCFYFPIFIIFSSHFFFSE